MAAQVQIAPPGSMNECALDLHLQTSAQMSQIACLSFTKSSARKAYVVESISALCSAFSSSCCMVCFCFWRTSVTWIAVLVVAVLLATGLGLQKNSGRLILRGIDREGRLVLSCAWLHKRLDAPDTARVDGRTVYCLQQEACIST